MLVTATTSQSTYWTDCWNVEKGKWEKFWELDGAKTCQSTWLYRSLAVSRLCMTPLTDAICSLTWPSDLRCHDEYHQSLKPCVLNHLFLSIISVLIYFNCHQISFFNTFISWQLIWKMKDLNVFQRRLQFSADLRRWWYTLVTAPVCLIGLCSEAIICI